MQKARPRSDWQTDGLGLGGEKRGWHYSFGTKEIKICARKGYSYLRRINDLSKSYLHSSVHI